MVALYMLLFCITVLSIGIYYWFLNDNSKGKKQPPGPLGLPFVGNLFSLGSRPHVAFSKWAKTYGPIIKVQLGRNRAVILNDVKLIKEAFNEPVFSGRPDNKIFSLVPEGKFGILNSDGEGWAEQRRFTLRTLRDFGFGRKNMEDMIMEEVNEITAWLKTQVGKPISINRKFSLAVLNSLWTIMTSERYNHDDPKLTKMMDTAAQAGKDASSTAFPLFFPELAEYFPGITGWNKILKAVEPMVALFKSTVQNRLNDPGDETNPRDFMDVYANEIKKTKDSNSSFYKQTGIKSMTAVVGDLHSAGSETTSTTITWAVLYLMNEPEVQYKLQEEIDRVVGKTRLPTLADRQNMPYTVAVMTEVLRISSIVPIGLIHNTVADTEFHGYHIPKNTMVIGNLYNAHHNVETWGDPENFRPERFLSKDGKFVIKSDALVPFSTGKRVCIGESLARDEFFLFMTTIFQQFQVDNDTENPSTLESDVGFLLMPKPFTVIMKDRLG